MRTYKVYNNSKLDNRDEFYLTLEQTQTLKRVGVIEVYENQKVNFHNPPDPIIFTMCNNCRQEKYCIPEKTQYGYLRICKSCSEKKKPQLKNMFKPADFIVNMVKTDYNIIKPI